MTDTTPSPTPNSTMTERVDRLEVDMLDVKVSLNQLIDYAFQSERRTTDAIERLAAAQVQTLQIVETMQTEIRDIQTEIRDIQSEVRGIQTENRRIIQRVYGEEPEGEA
jgi:hypothetical protein